MRTPKLLLAVLAVLLLTACNLPVAPPTSGTPSPTPFQPALDTPVPTLAIPATQTDTAALIPTPDGTGTQPVLLKLGESLSIGGLGINPMTPQGENILSVTVFSSLGAQISVGRRTLYISPGAVTFEPLDPKDSSANNIHNQASCGLMV